MIEIRFLVGLECSSQKMEIISFWLRNNSSEQKFGKLIQEISKIKPGIENSREITVVNQVIINQSIIVFNIIYMQLRVKTYGDREKSQKILSL